MSTFDDIFLQAMNSEEVSLEDNNHSGIQRGRIISQTDKGYFIALGGKTEMILPLSEINGSVVVGEEIDVVVMGPKDGIPQVSQKRALKQHSLEKIHESAENNTPVSATIQSVVKNKESKSVGYLVDIDGVEGFLPFSHIRLPKNEQELIGQKFNVVVIKLERDRVVVSERIIRDQLQKEYFSKFVESHKEGDKISVTVSSVADNFALVTAENITMFLHITQLDWKYIKNLNDVLKIGDKFDVIIDSIDTAKKSIRVSRKATIENPTLAFLNQQSVGNNIHATVIRFARGLAILEDANGVEMILPVGEMSWINKVSDPKHLLNVGDKVEVKIKELDSSRERIVVSLRDLLENPWTKAATTYALNTIHQGKVTSITEFGIFLVFDDGIQGLVRKEDIEWNNDNINLSERFKKGDTASAIVLNIDTTNEKLRLGIKQLSDNPYQSFANAHPIGTLVSGIVKNISKDGVNIELENNILAFIHISQLSMENITNIDTVCSEGDTIQAVVRRINVGQQRIELSIKEIAMAEEKAAIKEVINAQQQEIPTLGSLLGDMLKVPKK